jgi:seryl-tRNA synthetase
MSLTDRAKEVTGKAVAEAKKGAAKVQEKVENVQLRQKANGLAKEIGYLVVKEKAGETSPEGEIDRLVAEIRSIEEQLTADRSSLSETDAAASSAPAGE